VTALTASGSPLRTGWEPGCPDDDTVTRQAVVNLAARVEHLAGAMGGRTHRDERWVLGAQGLPTPFANVAVATRPISEPGDVTHLGAFFTTPFLLMSAWPTPDLAVHGFELVGHPPFMLRPAGGTPPPPSPPPAPAPAPTTRPTWEITEVHDEGTARRFARTLVAGYPVHGLPVDQATSLVDERAVGGGLRAWIGSVDGRDVSVAAVFTHSGLNQVEMVATHPDARGRGYGAALTWQAALAEPALPTVLIASDDGRPVYERMGFIPLTRWTLWIGSPAARRTVGIP
jgi:GNAT superfamily N-acetyltransferase